MNVRIPDPDDVVRKAMDHSQRLNEKLRVLLLYKDIITGEGLEFDRLRKYAPGDEARRIDWNSLARTNKLYTKIFKEERMLNVYFVVDLSKTMTIGTTKNVKNEYASVIAVTLARTAIDAGDNAGMIGFNEEVQTRSEPSLEDSKPHEFAQKLSQEDIYGGKTDWERVNEEMGDLGQDTFVFVISDFLGDTGPIYDFMNTCSDRFKGVFAVMVRDPTDSRLPKGVGKMYISDPETGKVDLVDADEVRRKYNRKAREQEAEIKKRIESSGSYFFKIHTDEDFTKEMARHLDEQGDLWS